MEFLNWFKRNKWELVEQGVRGIRIQINPILNYKLETPCVYDVYRKLKKNGTYKYKKVER